jgi:hypothetical protein
MCTMKQTAALFAMLVGLGMAPALSQETPPPATPEVNQGVDLMEQGAMLLLRGLMSQVEPQLDEMSKALADIEPMVRQLMELVSDIHNYHAPEVLPNGDILIRKKTPAELLAEPEGDIEL